MTADRNECASLALMGYVRIPNPWCGMPLNSYNNDLQRNGPVVQNGNPKPPYTVGTYEAGKIPCYDTTLPEAARSAQITALTDAANAALSRSDVDDTDHTDSATTFHAQPNYLHFAVRARNQNRPNNEHVSVRFQRNPSDNNYETVVDLQAIGYTWCCRGIFWSTHSDDTIRKSGTVISEGGSILTELTEVGSRYEGFPKIVLIRNLRGERFEEPAPLEIVYLPDMWASYSHFDRVVAYLIQPIENQRQQTNAAITETVISIVPGGGMAVAIADFNRDGDWTHLARGAAYTLFDITFVAGLGLKASVRGSATVARRWLAAVETASALGLAIHSTTNYMQNLAQGRDQGFWQYAFDLLLVSIGTVQLRSVARAQSFNQEMATAAIRILQNNAAGVVSRSSGDLVTWAQRFLDGATGRINPNPTVFNAAMRNAMQDVDASPTMAEKLRRMQELRAISAHFHQVRQLYF